MPRPVRVPLPKHLHNPTNQPQVGDVKPPSGLLGPTGAPIEEAPRILGPDGTPLHKRPEEQTRPTKRQAEEFIQTLIDVATECDCVLPANKPGGKGLDCPTCGQHTHTLMRWLADGDDRRYCHAACRQAAKAA